MKIKDLKFMPEFFDRYINLANKEIGLKEQLEASLTVLDLLKDKLIQFQDFQYEPGKWTPKDILQHCIDTERILAFRALAFARGDANVLPGFDENTYAKNTTCAEQTVEELLLEFKELRSSTVTLFNGFSEEMLFRYGVCFKTEISVLALGFTIVGHPLHHVHVLETKYFNASK